MKKQDQFALSLILNGVVYILLLIEFVSGMFLYYNQNLEWIWNLFRVFEIGVGVYMLYNSYFLRLLYQDSTFDRFYKIMKIVCILTISSSLLTFVLRNFFENGYGVLFTIRLIMFYAIVWFAFLLQSIGWFHLRKFVNKKGKVIIFRAVNIMFISTMFFLSSSVFSLIVSLVYEFTIFLALETLVIISFIITGTLAGTVAISHIIFGIIFWKNPLTESEEILSKKKCSGCGNFVDSLAVPCSYCGQVSEKSKYRITTDQQEIERSK